MDSAYQDRTDLLIAIGFNSYLEYLKSPLWEAIRKEVLIRDGFHCRAKRCSNNGAKHAHHISYTQEALLGLQSGSILTLCERHHKSVEYDSDGKKRPFRVTCHETFLLVTKFKLIKGQSDKRIGYWFRDQYRTSLDTGIRILARLKRDSPEWHKKIVRFILKMPTLARYRPYLK